MLLWASMILSQAFQSRPARSSDGQSDNLDSIKSAKRDIILLRECGFTFEE